MGEWFWNDPANLDCLYHFEEYILHDNKINSIWPGLFEGASASGEGGSAHCL